MATHTYIFVDDVVRHTFKVYDQEGQPCPNGTCRKTIERIVQFLANARN